MNFPIFFKENSLTRSEQNYIYIVREKLSISLKSGLHIERLKYVCSLLFIFMFCGSKKLIYLKFTNRFITFQNTAFKNHFSVDRVD